MGSMVNGTRRQGVMEQLKDLRPGLHSVKAEVGLIKRRLVNTDAMLTVDDVESLSKAEEDYREGKTKRLM